MFSFVVSAPEGKKSNTGVIVGGVIGVIFFLILIGVGVFIFLRWKSKYSFIVHLFKEKLFGEVKLCLTTFLRSMYENITSSGSETGFLPANQISI